MPEKLSMQQRVSTKAIVKWLLVSAVLVFVIHEGRKLWNSSAQNIQLAHPEWLLPAGLAYVVGWFPSVWFLQRLLKEMHHDIQWWAVARAYYCGHLGKYVPGKAMALIVRAGMLKEHGVPVTQSVAAAVLETLFAMGVGTALALATIGRAIPGSSIDALPGPLQMAARSNWVLPLLVIASTIVGVCVAGRIVSRVVSRIAARKSASVASELDESESPSLKLDELHSIEPPQLEISTRLLLQCLPLFTIGWTFHGLSLCCTLAVLGVDLNLVTQWLPCTTAVAIGTSIGFFLLLIPGGIGVREGLIVVVLTPLTGSKVAIAAAVLLRVLWFATEVLIAAVLYPIRGLQPDQPESDSHIDATEE